MSKYFGNVSGVTVYFDDILCAADSKEELCQIVDKVVNIARCNNIKFNPNKVQFFVNEVKYLGFLFNEFGHKPDPDRIKSIKELKSPRNVKELQRILGMVNYLRNHLPKLSEVLSPLRELLKKNVEWEWTSFHDGVFEKIKNMISNITMLSCFDPGKSIEIQTDASKDAIGCSLMQGGKPVLFASRSLNDSETQYAQIEKELLAVVFSLKKFHNYVYGHDNVVVYSDHVPLTTIIKKELHKIKNNRLRRLRLKLLPYSFNLKYLPGKEMHIADLLSRNICHEPVDNDPTMSDMVHTIGVSITFTDEQYERFVDETRKDESLAKVLEFYRDGWPNSLSGVSSELAHYFKCRNEITVEQGLVYYNERVLVPTRLRSFMLGLLHETHLGLRKMKDKVNKFLYWPGVMSDVKNLVEACLVCQRFQRSKIKEPLCPHDIPPIPFYKVAVDIAEFNKEYYLILVDYYSRWIEVELLRDKTSGSVIKAIRPIFARLGIPKELVADNNPFGSYEFKNFVKEWNIELILISPNYSQSNGLVEKAVGITKGMLQKCRYNDQDFNIYLLNYRNSVVAGLKYSPAQLLMSRSLRSKIPDRIENLKPKVVTDPSVTDKGDQELYYNKTCKSEDKFEVGDRVLVQNKFSRIWEKGVIEKKLGFRSYLVQINNKVYRRNSRFIRKFKENNLTKYDEFSREEVVQPTTPNDVGPKSDYVSSRSGRVIRKPVRLDL